MPEQPRPVLVVDLGAQYARLIARRVREAHVYSEIVPHDLDAKGFAAKRPAGIILSGGPASVYEPGAPQLDPHIFDLGVPVLGICYGHQLMARALGGEVAATGQREYGATALRPTRSGCPTATPSRGLRRGSASRPPPSRSRSQRWKIPTGLCSPCSSTPRCHTRRTGR